MNVARATAPFVPLVLAALATIGARQSESSGTPTAVSPLGSARPSERCTGEAPGIVARAHGATVRGESPLELVMPTVIVGKGWLELDVRRADGGRGLSGIDVAVSLRSGRLKKAGLCEPALGRPGKPVGAGATRFVCDLADLSGLSGEIVVRAAPRSRATGHSRAGRSHRHRPARSSIALDARLIAPCASPVDSDVLLVAVRPDLGDPARLLAESIGVSVESSRIWSSGSGDAAWSALLDARRLPASPRPRSHPSEDGPGLFAVLARAGAETALFAGHELAPWARGRALGFDALRASDGLVARDWSGTRSPEMRVPVGIAVDFTALHRRARVVEAMRALGAGAGAKKRTTWIVVQVDRTTPKRPSDFFRRVAFAWAPQLGRAPQRVGATSVLESGAARELRTVDLGPLVVERLGLERDWRADGADLAFPHAPLWHRAKDALFFLERGVMVTKPIGRERDRHAAWQPWPRRADYEREPLVRAKERASIDAAGAIPMDLPSAIRDRDRVRLELAFFAGRSPARVQGRVVVPDGCAKNHDFRLLGGADSAIEVERLEDGASFTGAVGPSGHGEVALELDPKRCAPRWEAFMNDAPVAPSRVFAGSDWRSSPDLARGLPTDALTRARGLGSSVDAWQVRELAALHVGWAPTR